MVQAQGPDHQGYGLAPGAPALPGGPGPAYGPGAGGFGPGPGGYSAPPAPRRAFPVARIGAAVTVVAGLVVLFCSLLNLYTVTVSPGNVQGSDVNGTVEIGIGFYNIVPFNAPVVALAVPFLMLVAAVTALPTLLGRGPQGTLVSAVGAISATLLSLVLMVSDPIPGVALSGQLATDFQKDVGRKSGITSVDDLVKTVVDIRPGAGLIVALIVGIVGIAGAVLAYLQIGVAKGAPSGPGLLAPPPGPAPVPSGQFPAPYSTGQFPAVQPPGGQYPTGQFPQVPSGQFPAQPASGQFPAQGPQ